MSSPAAGRTYSAPVKNQLWGKAAGRCAFPGCGKFLVADETADDPAVTIGKIAHIVAHSEDGPRGDAAVPLSERNGYANLVLLCGEHHDVVDGQPNTYTVDDLRGWKADLEKRVDELLIAQVADLRPVELDLVMRAVLREPADGAPTYEAPVILDKIERNGLGPSTAAHVTMGLAQEPTVRQYIQEISKAEPEFADSLVAGFSDHFAELEAEGLSGDDMFEALVLFAAGEPLRIERIASAIAVTAYLFHTCDVFT